MTTQKTTRKILSLLLVLCFLGMGVIPVHASCVRASCYSDHPREGHKNTHPAEHLAKPRNCCCGTWTALGSGVVRLSPDALGLAVTASKNEQPSGLAFSPILDELPLSIDHHRVMPPCCDLSGTSGSDPGRTVLSSTLSRLENFQSVANSQTSPASTHTAESRNRPLWVSQTMARAVVTPVYLRNLTLLF